MDFASRTSNVDLFICGEEARACTEAVKEIISFVAVCGRNRKVAEAFAKNGGNRSFDELEAEMLQGQKLQGVSTAREVYEVLNRRIWLMARVVSPIHNCARDQHWSPSTISHS
ncbi:Glycerol-3-phosphate dehydrogenase [NAD(+)] [Quillaja saponaria]|uniref:Glycerol-3-phosphate dehydrogenase [NAD(+)] n=1 Tax=Quillaja saponaria TaxID=32244 RepID=A0AAD7Q4E9_QUISA|nr:Glycerol-3-phosphate dehydrogenase [NAD(+)] [Quillaja saponaria]